MPPLFALDPDAFLTPDVLLKVMGAVASAGGMAAGAWWLAGRHYRSTLQLWKKKAEHFEGRAITAAAERDQQAAMATRLQKEYADATLKLTELNARFAHGVKVAHQWKALAEKYGLQSRTLDAELTRLRAEHAETTAAKLRLETETGQQAAALAAAKKLAEQAEARMRRALKLEGQLWAAKALQGRPPFRELAKRKVPVVSVLNLKGGVGKTTVTAHLGAALARRGYRVLVVDLDLQGSLTSLLLPQDKISQLFAGGLLAQHFFQKAADDRTTKITRFAQPVFDVPESGGSLSIVGTTDALAYAELNLTTRWLFQAGTRDTRFLLQKALHLMGVGRRFDVVLLDCPPVINASCVNALAASDFVLIPTALSKRSVERVPVLLSKVLRSEKFVKHVNHDVRVLGMVANRTHGKDLTGSEQDEWDHLGDKAKDVFKQPVKRFATTIPQFPKEIRDSESEFTPHEDDRLAEVFGRLAEEIEQELPSECRRLAKAPQ